jgi:hypothetical protein
MPKKLKFNEAAALHWAQGALKAQSVPVGEHVLDGCRVVITCPKGAKVIREAGTEGDGRDECPPKSLDLTREVLLLFVDRTGAANIPKARSIFLECFRAAYDTRDNPQSTLPAALERAAEDFFVSVQADTKPTKKTPAKRIGIDLAQILIEKA